MGPHFFKCGKFCELRRFLLDASASMGPHFFKCGKFIDKRFFLRPFFASMGPHFFKCGKVARPLHVFPRQCGFNGAALFQVRKALIFPPDFLVHSMLQWGRTFSSAESSTTVTCVPSPMWLQWGRTFSSAERNLQRLRDAFKLTLQWGRTFSSAERVDITIEAA